MRRIVAALFFLVVGTAVFAPAQTPNYVKTTIHNGSGDTMVITAYTDGQGRELQTRLDLGGARGRVVGNVYDSAGRLVRKTVPFVNINTGYCTEDVIQKVQEERGSEHEANVVGGQFPICYSEMQYKPDPLGRPAVVGAPGYNYSKYARPSRLWYTAASVQGEITGSSFVPAASLTENVLNAMETTTTAGSHFLTITKDPISPIPRRSKTSSDAPWLRVP